MRFALVSDASIHAIWIQVVFVDSVGANLKPASDLGMVTILVSDTDTALRELERVTGVQLLETAAPLPTPCNPSDVSHGYVPIKVSKHSLSQQSTLYPSHLKSLTETFVKYQRYLNVYYL